MRKALYFLSTLMLLTHVSCNGLSVNSSIGNSSPSTRPSDSSLVGTWKIDDESYKVIKSKFIYSGQEVKLIFFKDSTFKAYNFIDFSNSFGKNKLVPGKFLDAAGEWSVVNESGHWRLKMSFDSGKLYQGGMGTTYDLLQNDSIVTGIQFYTDDPDSGNKLLFLKEDNE